MPPKVRDLERQLKRAGFRFLPDRGKGSHRWYVHRDFPELIVEVAGNPGSDAKTYLEKDVRDALKRLDELSRQ